MPAPAAQIERAWHLLTVLLRLGRPLRPADLAAASPLPLSPDFADFLCRIPGSPLRLTPDNLVTAADSAVAALVRFLVSPPAPRAGIRPALQRRGSGELAVTYARKRKGVMGDLAVSAPKRVVRSAADLEGLRLPGFGVDLTSQVCLTVAGMLTEDGLPVDVSGMGHTASCFDKDKALIPSIPISTGVSSSAISTNHAGGTDETAKECNNPGAIIIYKEFPELLGDKHDLISTMPNVQESDSIWCAPSADPGNLTNALAVVGNAKVNVGICTQNEGTSLHNHGLREAETCAPEDRTACKLVSPGIAFVADTTSDQKDSWKPSKRLKTMTAVSPTEGLCGSIGELKDRRDGEPPKHVQAKRRLFPKQKLKRNGNQIMPAKENKADGNPKSHSEPKSLPNFETFTIEEEEGSGGYGTVYRARRKADGKIFAIKYPHANAHAHHINNELKMLERFGGRNFVIKYEGSFKSGESECFVLEHVEHDRPEILKKEMDILSLRWYGFCMFRALASLHKQGIAHRDVKPGNFLFSRKSNKGYLIDFNLANDLNQKFSKSRKSEISSSANDHASLQTMNSYSYTQARRRLNGGNLDDVVKEATNVSKKPLLPKNVKKRPNEGRLDTFPIIDHKNKHGSHAADGSGLTSAKDHTSTRTHSGDRMKQPIPCKGRKELLNFVHDAMQSPIQNAVTAPVSQRKRIAAPVGKADRRLVILTPMPLHSGGNPVVGAGLFKNKGNGKQKREGPCVGTKGFRAPEVLFRSYHQGCKVDIWSAGVTFLYLIIGRSPFAGDPEQNIKEIAKLRGSEDLWEVAKLHNCDTSFPQDLLDVQSLQSVELEEWCAMNTRRPEFLETVPNSLFDLLDKCLTVNPRRRITAEEALMHDFFSPCHETLKKHRLQRRSVESAKP